MIKYKIFLTNEEREELSLITKKGQTKAKKFRNALILLNCDKSDDRNKTITNKLMSEVLDIGPRTIDRVKKTFVEEGLDVVLNGKPRQRKYDRKIDGEREAHLVALCCSDPPEGYANWSLRLLSDKMVELNYVESISHETVRLVLKKRIKAVAKQRLGYSTK